MKASFSIGVYQRLSAAYSFLRLFQRPARGFAHKFPGEFLRALAVNSGDGVLMDGVAAELSEPCAVAFLSREEIEDRCRNVHSIIGYGGGRVR
jgi:hypothetical protein